MRIKVCGSLLITIVLASAVWLTHSVPLSAQPAEGTPGEPGPETSRSQTNQPNDEGGSERAPVATQRGTQLGHQRMAMQGDQPGQQDPRVERGKYLVHHVAMCIQCHSPRDGNGNLRERQLLMGAVIPLNSPYPQQTWAFRAPQIAGLPGWADEEVLSLLTTGARPDGHKPRLPMPPFRFQPDDAEAIIAYLRSLGR